jgi:hypothetical protein
MTTIVKERVNKRSIYARNALFFADVFAPATAEN